MENQVNNIQSYFSPSRSDATCFKINLTGQANPYCARSKIRLWRKDRYLLELVRYIHLNPLRAKLLKSIAESDKYPFSGHSALMGNMQRDFQDTRCPSGKPE